MVRFPSRIFVLCVSFILLILPTALFSAEKYQSIPDPRVQNSAIDLEISTTEARIELTRVDFWDGYLVFVGTVRALDATVCISRTDFSLRIDSIAYEPLERDKTRNGYNIDAPGTGFFTQCISGGDVEVILLPFAAPVSNGRAVLSYDGRSASLSQSLAQLQTVTQAAVPTPTPTKTYTPTPSPTPTATFTPAAATLLTERPDSFTLPVPSDARSVFHTGEVHNVGVKFSLERIDFWERLPDGIMPNAGVFAILTGTLSRSNRHPGDGCVAAGAVVMTINGIDYDMDYMRSAQEFYQVDFPGYFFPQCASAGSPVPTFMVFDVPRNTTTATLSFYNAHLLLTLGTENEVEVPVVVPTNTGTPVSPAAATVAAAVAATSEASTNSSVQTSVATTTSRTQVSSVSATVIRNANLRNGPGTNYDVVGSVSEGDEVEIIGMNSAADWYYLATGEWIAAFLVENVAAPIPTLAATSTPQPTATPTYDPNRTVYFNSIVTNAGSIALGLERISQLMQNPRLFNDEWTIQVAAAMVLIQLGHEEIVALDPPSGLEVLHARIIDATGDCSDSMDSLAYGIDNIDTNSLNRAISQMNSCTEKIGALADELESLE